MVIVYCATPNIYPELIRSINSVMQNNFIDKIYVLALEDKLPFTDNLKIQAINISRELDEAFGHSVNKDCQWTIMSFARLLLPSILKDEKRVLYLDADTIVDDDIEELFNMDMTDYYVAGALDIGMKAIHLPKQFRGNIYINAGVMMINLERMRKNMIEVLAVDFINNVPLMYPDQDTINVVCEGRIGLIPKEYHCSPSTEPIPVDGHPKIYHYTISKPWQYRDIAALLKYQASKID